MFGRIARIAALLVLSGCCQNRDRDPLPLDTPPLVVAPISRCGVEDGRGRFREIFVAVRDARHAPDAEDPQGESHLLRVAHEPVGTGRPVRLHPPRGNRRILVVPGLLGDATGSVALPFGGAVETLRARGYRIDWLDVSGRASCAYNAKLIRDQIVALDPDERLVLVGYSKGAPDSLRALVDFPEVRERVCAVLTVAGAVGGSPVADETGDVLRDLFGSVPLPAGSIGDGRAIESLERRTRSLWLSAHELPRSVRYYSIVAFTTRDRICPALQSAFDTCSRIDARNDGQLLAQDQIVPGGTLLGFADASHWAIAMPLETAVPLAGSYLSPGPAYPRHILLEAALRYIEESLEQRDESSSPLPESVSQRRTY
jgi:hypothetical protein